MTLEVKLMASTPNASQVIAAAAKLCYSASGAMDLYNGLNKDKIESFLKMLNESGHMSPFEHVSFTFSVEGISRVTTHQLVRHRIASYSQQSQRYVSATTSKCIFPPAISNNAEAFRLYQEQIEAAWNCYNKLLSMGVAKEDARFILPHGADTRIVITMNARELHHFFLIRLCKRSQWEIRELARQMYILAREDSPEVFKLGGPSCIVYGECKESHPCGEPYKNIDEMLAR